MDEGDEGSEWEVGLKGEWGCMEKRLVGRM